MNFCLLLRKFRTIMKNRKKVLNRKRGDDMTGMRRVTVPIPNDMDKAILEMKKKDEYVRCSYAELVRLILNRGLRGLEKDEAGKG